MTEVEKELYRNKDGKLLGRCHVCGKRLVRPTTSINKIISSLEYQQSERPESLISNIKELICDFATEVTKEYIEMANKFENENKELKNELQQSKEILIDALSILTEEIPIGVTSVESYNKYLICNRIKKFLKGENKNA